MGRTRIRYKGPQIQSFKKKALFLSLNYFKTSKCLKCPCQHPQHREIKIDRLLWQFYPIVETQPEYSNISRLTVCFLTTTLFKQSGLSPIIVLEMSGNLGVIWFRYSSRSVEARSTEGSWVKLYHRRWLFAALVPLCQFSFLEMYFPKRHLVKLKQSDPKGILHGLLSY